MTLSPPFVDYDMIPTMGVNSDKTIIFGSEQKTSYIENVIFSNTSNNRIYVTSYIAREVETGVESDFVVIPKLVIEALGFEYVKIPLILRAGDLLYAYSDEVLNYFNTFVSIGKFNELPQS